MKKPSIKDVMKHDAITTFTGEWLVRHTVAYNETSYKQWYLFDIAGDDGKLLSTASVYMEASR